MSTIPDGKLMTVPMILHSLLSLLSLIGSVYIIQHVLRSKKRRNKALTQIMLGMSIMDVLSAIHDATSVLQITGTDPIPINDHSICISLGFIGVGSSLSSMLYSGSLACYFYLTICRSGKWSESRLQRSRLVFLWHIVPLLVGWTLAIVGLGSKIYNDDSIINCHISNYPDGEKGTLAYGAMIVFHFIFLSVFVWLVISMSLIYCSISKTERTTSKYRIKSLNEKYSITNCKSVQTLPKTQAHSQTTMRREVATQALLFCLSFVVTYIFTAIGRLDTEFGRNVPLVIVYLASIFSPLQGFWNTIVYIRPRYLNYQRKKLRLQLQQKAKQDKNINTDNDDDVVNHQPGRFEALIVAIRIDDDDDDDGDDGDGEGNDKDNKNYRNNDDDILEFGDSNTMLDLSTLASKDDENNDEKQKEEEEDMNVNIDIPAEKDIELGLAENK